MAQRVTMVDVARDAGVSRATVSLVMRGSTQIPDATAARVRASMDSLGYVYNRVAGNLRGGTARSFGLLLTNARNPYLTEMIMALEEAVEGGDEMILTSFSLGGAEREGRLARKLAGQGVAGLIMLPSSDYAGEHVDELQRTLGVPVVMVVRDGTGQHDRVVIDDHAAGRLLGEHLAERGVRSVHVIGGYSDAANYAARVAGVRAGLATAPHPIDLVAWPDDARRYELAAGSGLTEHVVGRRPDALVTFNDAYAIGVYSGLRRLGLEPGRDIAVASFDKVPLSQELGTPLTSVDTRPDLMAGEALRLLRARLDDPGRAPERAVIAPSLDPSASTLDWRPPGDPR